MPSLPDQSNPILLPAGIDTLSTQPAAKASKIIVAREGPPASGNSVEDWLGHILTGTAPAGAPPQTLSATPDSAITVDISESDGTEQPIVPIDTLSGTGTFLGNLQTADSAAQLDTGLYLVIARWEGITNSSGSERSSVGFIVEWFDSSTVTHGHTWSGFGGTWRELTRSSGSYVRSTSGTSVNCQQLHPVRIGRELGGRGGRVHANIRIRAYSPESFGDGTYTRNDWSFTSASFEFLYVGGTGTPVTLPATVTQAEAEAGTSESKRIWTPERVKQAIAALAPAASLGQTGAEIIAAINAATQIINFARVGLPAPASSTRGYLIRQSSSGETLEFAAASGAAAMTGTAIITAINDSATTGAINAGRLHSDVITSDEMFAAIGGVALPYLQAGSRGRFLRQTTSGNQWELVSLNIPTLPSIVTQAEAEAGTSAYTRMWTPQRVAQAIAALAPSGGGDGGTMTGAQIVSAINSSTSIINAARLHADIARDSELPGSSRLLPASIGSNGQVLTVVAGAAAWAAASSGGSMTGTEIITAINTAATSGLIDADHLAAGIARDTEVTAAVGGSHLPTLASSSRGYYLRQTSSGETWELVDLPSTTIPSTATQAEAEAGSVTSTRMWTPERVKQAIAALAPSATVTGATITVAASAPGSPSEGDFWWDSTNSLLKVYISSSWTDVGGGTTMTGAEIITAINGASTTINDARIASTIARDSELPAIPATVTQAEAEAGTVTSTRMWTPQRVSQAIAALASSGATWSSGSAAPSGGSDGDFYIRTGSTSPGIHLRTSGSWSNILEPGDPDQTGAEIITAINAASTAIDAARIDSSIARDTEVTSAVGGSHLPTLASTSRGRWLRQKTGTEEWELATLPSGSGGTSAALNLEQVGSTFSQTSANQSFYDTSIALPSSPAAGEVWAVAAVLGSVYAIDSVRLILANDLLGVTASSEGSNPAGGSSLTVGPDLWAGRTSGGNLLIRTDRTGNPDIEIRLFRVLAPQGPEGPAASLPATASQNEAEAGSVTETRMWTPQRVKQAVAALESDEVTVAASAPSSPSDGDFWWDSTNSLLKLRVSTAWQTIGPATAASLPANVTQAEAEAGTVTANRSWSPQRVKQAIDALQTERYKGSWSAGVYAQGDLAERHGHLYFCHSATVASDTTAPRADRDHWTPITDWHGAYDSTTWYSAGSLVTYNNAVWIATGQIQSGSSWVPGTHANWERLSEELPAIVTQTEAEAGTVTNTRMWSPKRVAQAIAALASSGATITVATTAPASPSSGEFWYDSTNSVLKLYISSSWVEVGPASFPADATQTEAEAGTETGNRMWSPQRVKQAVDALGETLFKGLWVSGTSYAKGDIVEHDNHLWICEVATSSTTSPDKLAASWNPLSEYRDAWQSGDNYRPGDMVLYSGEIYICVGNINAGTTSPDKGANWRQASGGRWRGNWADNQTYRNGDLVNNGGRLFICIGASVSSSTGPAGDRANWTPVSDWQGAWNTSIYYVVGSMVSYNNHIYVCIQASTSADSDPSQNTSDWLRIDARTDTEIDARIATPAKAGDTTVWGTGKLGTGTADDTTFLRGDGAWAVPRYTFRGNFASQAEDLTSDVYLRGDLVWASGELWRAVQNNPAHLAPGQDPQNWEPATGWRGGWAQEAYHPGEIVKHNGRIYINISAVGNDVTETPTQDTDRTNWKPIDTPLPWHKLGTLHYAAGSSGNWIVATTPNDFTWDDIPSDAPIAVFRANTGTESSYADNLGAPEWQFRPPLGTKTASDTGGSYEPIMTLEKLSGNLVADATRRNQFFAYTASGKNILWRSNGSAAAFSWYIMQ